MEVDSVRGGSRECEGSGSAIGGVRGGSRECVG